METWPLWQCIPDGKPCRQNNWQSVPCEGLIKLIQLQWKLYGTRLDLLADIYRDVEDLDEIDKLIRQRPRYTGQVWFGG